MILLATGLLAGCVREVTTYVDSGQTIDIGVNQEFVIAIGANPTTGYDWEVSLSGVGVMLELVDKVYKSAEEAEHEIVGTGGVDYFRFKAVEKGVAEITMDYKRPGEETGIEQKVFTVNIR